ncbi:conjugal transfer pilus assembly protein TraU [Vibrio mediterranei]|uniref:conjugal transfer pilus assembly protein TraU n=1 Tax=Vibrio mediterranei TaxID=689 RepID=UPI001EFD7972|nr:conjugal transfer pilus assembly protein TraU [Vibrio mediterranei]MCG9658643.1 TraU family protein [Vibrio mediterranei]
MRAIKLYVLGFIVIVYSSISIALPISGSTCTGRFPNPITDICWSCMFPISIGGLPVVSSDKPDTGYSGPPICTCPMPVPPYVRVGVSIAFWEPVRLVDVTRSPGCLVNLGGLSLNLNLVGAGQGSRPTEDDGPARYQVHWYVYPITYLLSAIVDVLCLESQGFDLAYMTEIDPLWQDDELSFLLNPEAVLFNNPIATAACAADCVASTAGLPLDPMFWCLGCRGTAYPMNGSVDAQHGGIMASLTLVERMTYKLHREAILWGSVGSAGLCGSYPMPIMQKSQYRSQVLYPIPTTSGYFGCNPYGRSTILYETGKEYPVAGEHFGWLVWRKRNCCAL